MLDNWRDSHYNKQALRGVAQLVARMVRDHEAASSSLATPTTSEGYSSVPFPRFAKEPRKLHIR